MMNFKNDVVLLVRSTRQFSLPLFGKAAVVTNKGATAADVVTAVDREIETYLREELFKLYPNISFYGEEFGGEQKEPLWICDPVDGTASFVRGIPFCTTMLALVENGQVTASCIYDFVNDDMYWAVKGGGAFKNDEKISVSNRVFTDSISVYGSKLDSDLEVQKMLALKKYSNLVKVNAAGYEFIQVALGIWEAKINLNPNGKMYDYAPGALLVQEAGGVVANIGSTSYDYRNLDLIAANPIVFKELTEGPEAIFPITE